MRHRDSAPSIQRSWPAVVAAGLALVLLTVAWPAPAKKPAKEEVFPTLPLSIHVVHEEGRPVKDEAWIDAQVAESERLFSQCGVHFAKGPGQALDARFARLETRKDRDDLASSLEKGKINVMVVASLRDVDDPSRYRMGVHWRPRSNLQKHFVIVAANAMPTVLAHELGHFFGNGHSKVKNNVMSYERDGSPVFLDANQYARIRASAKMFLGSKELVP